MMKTKLKKGINLIQDSSLMNWANSCKLSQEEKMKLEKEQINCNKRYINLNKKFTLQIVN